MGRINYTNQHFLISDELARQVVDLAEVKREDVVLEIGPGKGILTRHLSKQARKVVAIEKDSSMIPHLTELEEECPNVSIIYGDALSSKWPKRANRLISNIPFNISEPLINRLFGENLEESVLFVGERLAEEMSYAARGKPRTRLGLLSSCYFTIETLLDVDRDKFDPIPATDARVISLTPLRNGRLRGDQNRQIIRYIWDQGRKPVGIGLEGALANFTYHNFPNSQYIPSYQFVSELGIPDRVLGKPTRSLTGDELILIHDALRDKKFAKKLRNKARRFSYGDYS